MSETPKDRRDAAALAETIFIAARDLLRPRERAVYLDNACGEDRALRERVESMLNAEQKADQFLANNPLEVDELPFAPGDTTESAGSMIGRYKLLQKIGEGGCGVVYMAEQEEPIRRRVALKVIKLGMDTRQVIARFEAERQALAMMDHPNIAKVLDAGTTGVPLTPSLSPTGGEGARRAGEGEPGLSAGRPYFVMELVRGIRITDYCDQNNLSTRERLDLFVKVAQAIQHAHQKGIIHRDIKPSNVLVTLHDGVPVPKVIDFGLAKAMEQKLTDKTLFTQFEQFIGTPAYTSPEQAEMSGLDIDTRGDIYSLGVLLYELLVGQTPFDTKELLKSGLNEMRRIIREREPNRPSTRLSTMLAEERTATAQRRAASSPELIHLLKGDLDWIVMKCLEKDRTRRYETASGLATDIQNYLGNEPVVARPPSTAYRFGKLVRRNKLAFAAATAVIAALLAGIVVSMWQAARARRAELAAKEEKESAEAVLQFVRDKILAADRPEGQKGGLGKDVTLRQAIDAAESQIATAFPDRPVVEAAIRKTLGESYHYLGESALAVPQLERALALRRQSFGLLHAGTASALRTLLKAYSRAGKSDRSLPIFEEILKLNKAKHGPTHPDTLTAMNNLGVAYSVARKHDQARTLLEETLQLRKAKQGLDHPDTFTTMNNLALAYQDQGRLDQATSLLEETLRLQKAKLGSEHSDTLRTMASLSVTYGMAGKHDQDVALAEELFGHTKRKLGPEHPDTLSAMYELAGGYRDAGKHEQSVSLLEETLKLRKTKLGAEHPDTLSAMYGLAGVYLKAQKHNQALPLLEETFQIRKARLGPEHRDTLDTMSGLAVAIEWAEPGDLNRALPLYEETLKRMKATDHPHTLTAIHNLGGAYMAAGKLEQAETLYREFLEQKRDDLTAIFGLAGVLVARAKSDTTNSARSRERAAESLQLAGDGLAKARVRYTNDPAKLETSLRDGADIFFRHDRYAEAEPLYREVLQSRRHRLGAEHKDVISTTASLARLLADWAWAERTNVVAADVRRLTSSGSSASTNHDGMADQSLVTSAPMAPLGRAREAERLLRECLAAHLNRTNATYWRTGDVKSRLGGALVSLAVTDRTLDAATRETRFVEAETLLLESNQRLQESQSAGRKYKRDALERLTRLYEAWNKPANLSQWQQKLEAFDNEKSTTFTVQKQSP